MRPMAPGEVARLNAHQADAMQDTCRIHRLINGAYVPDSSATPCRWNDMNTAPMGMAYGAPSEAGEVALPRTTVITRNDRIELLTRMQQAIPAELWEVNAEPLIGPHAIIASIRKLRT